MLLLPGDYVGREEEFIPGIGLYSENGEIFASNTGELQQDREKHIAKLVIRTRIPKSLAKGIITLGQVTEVFNNVVFLVLDNFESKKFTYVAPDIPGVIKISEVDDRFIKDMKNEFRIGDIVRVKVLEVKKHTIFLTTKEKNLGVIKAFCSKCRNVLIKERGNILVCESCGNMEMRKTAYDYGLWKAL